MTVKARKYVASCLAKKLLAIPTLHAGMQYA